MEKKTRDQISSIIVSSVLFFGLIYMIFYSVGDNPILNPSLGHHSQSNHMELGMSAAPISWQQHTEYDLGRPWGGYMCLFNLTVESGGTQHADELEAALSEASMPNKTLIIAIVNKAYVEGDKPMLDLFLDGFWLGENTTSLVDHLLLVAIDQTSFDRCNFLRLHCYMLRTDGVSFDSEKLFMSEDFIRMMWRRTLFLGDVLRRGYSFIFTDTDILWLRNPFPRLSSNDTVDLQISTDHFNGNQWSDSNPINTGFYMVRSNNRTVSLFDAWYAMKDNSTGIKEQDVLDRMVHQGYYKKLGLRIRFLDTLYFSGFCQNSKDPAAVATVHANCCRTISAKVADLTAVVHDWKRFRGSAANETASFKWTRHEACARSW